MKDKLREFHISYFIICSDDASRLSGKNYYAANIIDAMSAFVVDIHTPNDITKIKYIVDKTNITYAEMHSMNIILGSEKNN